MGSIYRIEVYSKIADTRALVRKKKLECIGFSGKIESVHLADVYTINKFLTDQQLNKFAAALSNPVTQIACVLLSKKQKRVLPSFIFSYAIEIGFLPGVTDNVSNTAKEIFRDMFNQDFADNEGIYTSQITFISGKLKNQDAEKIGLSLANSLIQRIHIKSFFQYKKDYGMSFIVPKVALEEINEVASVDLNISDSKLKIIGRLGIANPDGTRRGPLALSLPYLKTIQVYFKKKRRNPTDIELESLAQTWSEHCKHTIFADPVDEIKDGLFKRYIKRATETIRKEKGINDFCVSVFSDNSGAIRFDEKYLITHKVETHNSPCALDPFGGAITGIVGVNRDTIGFGLGAKPIANYYGFCFADPRVDIPLYKGQKFTQKMLSSRRIMDGVIEGVNVGGNCSGIPTPYGFLYFDERYRGKPLVFVGTIGLIPGIIKGKPAYIKKARPGDYIVMAGGRVGKDGIHGATFSSEALDAGSPVTAVQIGDPITQKKLSDAVVKEARDLLLYDSITDNGAGGLSCSVAEMAKESGGCEVELSKVPTKYPGLAPWEIWVSESQERMTLAVPKKNWKTFQELMIRRGVEATIIGKFTNSGKCVVCYRKKIIMDIDMQFLHYGLPKRLLKTTYKQQINSEPTIPKQKDLTKSLLKLLARLNIAGYEFITQQYDHIVQANLALSPLQGRGRVNADAVVIRPILNSVKGIIMSYGLYPSYGDIDTYHMAAASIDTAIRNAVAAGADLKQLALLDNFCWCSSNDPFRLGQLKRAANACYDYATAYGTPFISGKDSMFNDFFGFDKEGKPIKISIPPTLLVTSVGIIDDVAKLISLDVKKSQDLVYLLGETSDELGGSEYFSMYSDIRKKRYLGNNIPKVDALKNTKLYKVYYSAVQKELIASSIGIGRGGIGVALVKMAIGGKLGLHISLGNIKGRISRDDFTLFSESQGRILVTVDPVKKTSFEKLIGKNNYSLIGEVSGNRKIIIRGLQGNIIVKTTVSTACRAYKSTFKDY